MPQNQKGTKITKETYRQILKDGFDRAPPSKENSLDILFERCNVLPGIEVKDFGLLGLPLHPLLLTALKSTGTRVSIQNEQWLKLLKLELREITEGLGRAMYSDEVDLALHSMTLEVSELEEESKLEEESEFAHHWPAQDLDDEGFFGYLIVTLPTHHTGGTILVSTNRDTKYHWTSQLSHHRYQILSFFRQCEYRSLPLMKGQRIQLVFKIFALEGKKPPVIFTGKEQYVRQMVKAMRVWKTDPDRTEALYYGYNFNQLTTDYTKDITRKRIAEILMEELRLGLYHGRNTYMGLQDGRQELTFDGLGRCSFPVLCKLNGEKVDSAAMDQFVVQFGASSDYFRSMLSRVNHTTTKKEKKDKRKKMEKDRMGILKNVPNDILDYILSSYMSGKDLVQLDGVSRGMIARVDHSVRTIMNRFAQEAIRMGKHEILSDWRGLRNHSKQYKRHTPYEAIICIMPDLVYTDSLVITGLVATYGGVIMMPKMMGYLHTLLQTSSLLEEGHQEIIGRLMNRVRRSYVSQGIEIDSTTPYCTFIKSWITAVLGYNFSRGIPLLKHLFLAENYTGMRSADGQLRKKKRDLKQIKIFMELSRDLMDVIVKLKRSPLLADDWSLPFPEVKADHCPRCRVVGDFLKDPKERTTSIRFPKPQRVHVVTHLIDDLPTRMEKSKKMLAALRSITKYEPKDRMEEEDDKEDEEEEEEEDEEEEKREEKSKKRATRGKGPARKQQRRK
ncbi:hypothetical protein PROFUN_11609 [Planoprotostelium fungivorum]|uniref:Uncharacterized protein n=1 Tax=Planoprotostelium fungivorum TaxID=1890364 RepID=A0A2P6N2B0_9EUKA|nr:hypothetical protein PROFUN_11609 [Planoprotostelium fungivorum]